MNKPRPLVLLVLICSLQLTVPLTTVLSEQFAISRGTTVGIPVRTIDPYDPLRGRYLNLRMDFLLPEGSYLNGKAWLILEPGQETIAVRKVVYQAPESDVLALEVRISKDWTTSEDGKNKYRVNLPEEEQRWYLREDLALKADKLLLQSDGTTNFELKGSVFQGRFRATQLLYKGAPFN